MEWSWEGEERCGRRVTVPWPTKQTNLTQCGLENLTSWIILYMNNLLLSTPTLPGIPFSELSSTCRLLGHDIHRTRHVA